MTEFPLMADRQPEELKETFLRAYRETGTAKAAAEYLGLTRESYYRYIRRLGFLEELRQVRDELREGTRAPTGPMRDRSEFGRLVAADPEDARDLLKMAYDDSVDPLKAAAALGITTKWFYDYVKRFNLLPELQEVVLERARLRRERDARRAHRTLEVDFPNRAR